MSFTSGSVLASNTTDWITAVGTAFAAVGTVGAVIIALWQTVWRERADLKVRAFYRQDDNDPGGGVLIMTADNPRQTPINVLTAGLSTSQMVNVPVPGKSSLPQKLGHKDSAAVSWSGKELREFETTQGRIFYGSFMSEVDGGFRTPMPGGRKKPKWISRSTEPNTEFEPPGHPPWADRKE